MDAPSTENQGIQPDPLYVCGWSFQDLVEVHTKAKALSMLPWMHHQQRIKGFNQTRCTRVVDRSKNHSRQHAAMDAPSTENQGIQPDPLYACGWSFQDRVEVHTKAKQAFSTLPWMHYQQRIKEFNRTRCTRVVDRSKIVLRSTPKPNKPSACCHGCTINRESRNTNRPIVHLWLIVPRSCWGTHQSQTSLRQAAMDAPDVWKWGNEISLKQQIVS